MRASCVDNFLFSSRFNCSTLEPPSVHKQASLGQRTRRKRMTRDSNDGQERRSWGLGVMTHDPLKICRRGSEYVLTPPENVTFFHSKLLLYNSKFHIIKDEQLDIITSRTLFMLTMLPSLCLISSKQTKTDQSVPLLLYWTLSYHGPRQNSKTWVQVTGRRQSSCAVLPTTDRMTRDSNDDGPILYRF